METWRKPEPEKPCPAADCGDGGRRPSLDYSTPLRSARSNANPSSSPFYKLSAELSREPLRTPGAVPFFWEQSPGLCKISPSRASMAPPRQAAAPPEASMDPAKHGAGNLSAPSPEQTGLSPLMPIAQPPAPRSSNLASSSIIVATSAAAAAGAAIADSASNSSSSDIFSATAGGVSVDGSAAAPSSGPSRPSSTPSDARDFILHRFLPAAHTIAAESPQTQSRRFLPPDISAGGSFRDYGGGAAACAEPAALGGASFRISHSSLLHKSPSAISAWRWQVSEESFHTAADELQDAAPTESEEDEPPPRTARSCGIFPFRIHISIHSGRNRDRSHSASKHLHHKNKRTGKKGSRLTCPPRNPKRIMDILCEDEASSYGDESPAYYNQSRKGAAERERNSNANLTQTPMLSPGSFCGRSFHPCNPDFRDSPRPYQNRALWPSDFSVDDSLSFYDASSRFCSPSPAALHGTCMKSLHGSHLSALTTKPHSSRSGVGSVEGCPCTYTIEQHHHSNGICCCCNTHNTRNSTPRSCHTQISLPSSCLTPPSSHPSSPQDSSANQDMATMNNTGFDNFSCNRDSEQPACGTDSAPHEDEKQETNALLALSRPGVQTPQLAPLTSHGSMMMTTSDTNTSKTAENFPENHKCLIINAIRDPNRSNRRHTVDDVSNSNSHRCEHQNDIKSRYGGDMCACSAVHPAQTCHLICVKNASPCAYHGDGIQYICSGNHNVAVHSAMNGVRTVGMHEFPWSRIAPPPPPKSPTHSWLDKRMLTSSAASKGPSRSSRFSCIPDKPAIAAVAPPDAAPQSKWEALVKGSHL